MPSARRPQRAHFLLSEAPYFWGLKRIVLHRRRHPDLTSGKPPLSPRAMPALRNLQKVRPTVSSQTSAASIVAVMAGLVPAIHVF